MTTRTGWRRCSGLVSAATPHAGRAQGFLDGARVLALIESDPEAPSAVAVTIALDEQDRVAVLTEDNTRIVAGPPLAELAEALAQECQALVVFGHIVAEHIEEAEEERSEDPFESEIGLEWARVPERAVVLTRAGQRELEDLATAANTVLYARTHGPGYLALLEDGPAMTELEWQAEHLPVVLLERGASFPSVTVIEEPGRAHLYSWDATLTVVPGDPQATELVHPFIDSELGPGALVRGLVNAAPEADVEAVRSSLEQAGEQGMARMVAALGLPAEVTEFLAGARAASDLPDLVELDAVTVAEVVRRAMDDAAEDARAHMEQMREAAEDARNQARESARANVEYMRRTATEAGAAAQSFADPDEHPTLAWTTPAAGILQGAGAIFAMRQAVRGVSAPTAGSRLWAIVGGVLATASVANLALAALPWLRRLRERD